MTQAILKRLRSKTYWAAIIGALLMVIEHNSGIFSLYLPESIRTMAVVMWPVLMVGLRELTTSALADK
jgi:uncharacterized membrane protein